MNTPRTTEDRAVWTGDRESVERALADFPRNAKLAIVGSVQLDTLQARRLIHFVLTVLDPVLIVSGGAKGIDTLAEAAAPVYGIAHDIRLPEVPAWWAANGKKGYAERNLEIATACTALIRIAWVGSTTYGSGWTRDRAAEMGKPTATFWLEKE